jgi:SAM-dependent methyltransferase
MRQLDNHLKCPNCDRVGTSVITSDHLDCQGATCGFCNHEIAIRNGTIDFAEHIPLSDPGLNPAQKLMNSRSFAFIYESLLWRPLHTYIASGITLAQEIRKVFEIAKVRQAQLVVDLACGTGLYARAFAGALPEADVYGVDISPGMLSQARKVAQRKSLRRLTFVRGDIYKLPFGDHSVNWVHCGGALHLFSELKPLWREIARIVKPGGVFTAQTIVLSKGLIHRIQQWAMRRGRATFFQPDQLVADLNAAGFFSFFHKQYRIILLFSAIRDVDKAMRQ